MNATFRSLMAAAPSPLSLLTNSNALLSRELRVALRNERAFALLAVYVAILGAIIASYFPADQSVVLGTAPGSGGEGRSLFYLFVGAQAMMVVLLLPALAAGSLAQERERRTLEPLLLTPMTPAQIVWGKAVGVLLFGALLIAATIPVTSLCFLLNGIAPVDVIGAYAFLMGLAAFVTGFGLYCSARWQSTTQAIVACYGLLPFALGLLIIFSLPGSVIGGIYLIGAVVYQAASWRSRITHNVVLVTALLGIAGFLCVWAGLSSLGGSNFAIIVFVLPYLLLVFRLGLEETGREIAKYAEPRRPTAERIDDLRAEWKRAVSPPEVVYLPSPTGRALYTSPAPVEAPPPPVKPSYGVRRFLPDNRNPVLMKDLRAGLLGKFSYLGRFSYIIAIASELWILLQVLTLSSNTEFEGILQGQFSGWANLHLALVMTAGAIFGSRALAPEREQQTLVQLLTTPLLPMTIVYGKLMAVLVYTFYVFVMGAPLALLFASLGIVPWVQALSFFLLEIAAGAMAATWGILCSMQGLSVRRALGQALGGLASLFFANLIVHNVLLSDVSRAAFTGTLATPLRTLLVIEFDRLVLPFTVMSNILSPLPGDEALAFARGIASVCIYMTAAVVFMVKTTVGFRRYMQNL